MSRFTTTVPFGLFSIAAAALVSASPVSADDSSYRNQRADEGAMAADDTGMNAKGRYGAGVTADSQAVTAGDNEVAAKIRRSIVADDSLSTYGHNVKIVTDGGKVTLKGPVKSEAERKAVIAKAAEVVGASNVTSELMVDAE